MHRPSCRAASLLHHHRRTNIFIIAILRRFAPIVVRASAFLAPLALTVALLAAAVDNAWADDGHPGGKHPLHQAAEDGELTTVIHLLDEHGIDKDAKADTYPYDDGTPLHIAAYRGHRGVVAYLIGLNADLDAEDEYGQTPLHRAYRHWSIVSLLIAGGAEVNAKDDNDETPLHSAARGSDPLVAYLLITARASVNAKNFRGETPLHIAAYQGHPAIVSLLLTSRASVNERDSRRETPIYGAIYYERTSIVLMLLESGAGVYTKNSDGDTPLHVAANLGEIPIARALIERGANVNSENNDGDTPLHLAKYYKSMMSLLIDEGASVNRRNHNRRTPLHEAVGGFFSFDGFEVSLLIAAGALVTVKDNNGRTPLHESVAEYDYRGTRASLLIAAGADVNAKDNDGNTPLHRAGESDEFNVVVLSMLIAAGADVNAKDNDGNTPLRDTCYFFSSYSYYSCYTFSGGAEFRAVLVEAGAHWGEPCANGKAVNPEDLEEPCICPANRPFLHDGLSEGNFCYPAGHARLSHDSVVNSSVIASVVAANNQALAAHYTRDHEFNPDGGYHLHSAAERDSHFAALGLLTGGANIALRRNGDTPLHAAIRSSSFRAASVLISRGANPDSASDNRGDTPLHLAARRNDSPESAALVSLLLERGANPNTRNNDNWRPLDLAFHGGNTPAWSARRKIMAALISGGAEWNNECTGGTVPNENYRPTASAIADCVCPRHLSEQNSHGVCECPSTSHLQVNRQCLPRDSAEVDAEIEKMRADLARLRTELVSLNYALSLALDEPREEVEPIAMRAEKAFQEIAWRRNNFIALARTDLAGLSPPLVAMSDTETECRMRGGEVRIDSGSGTRICLGLDRSGTFCLVDSGGAFPCRGLFKHVRRCNDVYHRPALNAFICGARCGANETARGKGCE